MIERDRGSRVPENELSRSHAPPRIRYDLPQWSFLQPRLGPGAGDVEIVAENLAGEAP